MFELSIKKKISSLYNTNFKVIKEDESIQNVLEYFRMEVSLLVVESDYKVVGYISPEIIVSALEDTRFDIDNFYIEPIIEKKFDLIDENFEIDEEELRNMLKGGVQYIVVDKNKRVSGFLSKNDIMTSIYKSLLQNFNTLSYIAEQIEEGICAIDKDGVVIMWNKFMQERYNISAETILGRKMNEFLVDTISERALNTKTSISDIYYSKKINEDLDLYGVVRAKPIYWKDEFVGVVCTEVDVEEARRINDELAVTQEKIKYLENEVKQLSMSEFDQILGKSYQLEKAKNIAKQVARTNSSIMLNGESGTGKEVFARAIHEYSGKKGTFIPVNCSAIPQELFESEFFGYAPGAFTGASKNGKAGIFELANGGTVFLDEISELPYNMQAKLLRVLQEREVRRVGGDETIKINVRIISASNKDLNQMILDGKFRDDLFYRLNVVEIKLPPLRDRNEDIGILIYHFLEKECMENNKPFLKISRSAFKMLERYEWKGNIRELKNTIENMVVLASKPTLEIDDIPEYIKKSMSERSNEQYPMDLKIAVEIFEKNKIKSAIEMAEGNKTKAAKILNIPRTTLYYKLEHYGIDI